MINIISSFSGWKKREILRIILCFMHFAEIEYYFAFSKKNLNDSYNDTLKPITLFPLDNFNFSSSNLEKIN